MAALGALLAMPALAQTATTPAMPAVKPPVAMTAPSAATPAAPMAVKPVVPMAAKPATAAPVMPAAKPAMAAPVDLNTATAAELDKVKFIGKKRAAKIIAGRPWKSPDDLVAKKVLPQKVFDKIKDRFVAR